MKFKNLIIISDINNSHLGLGEYLRLASFLPNINYEKIIWYSDIKLRKILKEVDYLKSLKNISTFSLKNLDAKDLIINLTNKDINGKFKIINILKFSKNENYFKHDTTNLLDLIAKKLNIKKYKVHSNKKKYNENQVYINWHVPKKWKIKMYPKLKWKLVYKEIKKNIKQPIEFQKKFDDLEYIINNIKKAKIVISVVSLACHLAILFNKKLIMLSGPNFFKDINLYKKAKVIYPDNFCNYRPCNLPNGIFNRNCGCMPFIDERKIITETLNEI